MKPDIINISITELQCAQLNLLFHEYRGYEDRIYFNEVMDDTYMFMNEYLFNLRPNYAGEYVLKLTQEQLKRFNELLDLMIINPSDYSHRNSLVYLSNNTMHDVRALYYYLADTIKNY